MVEIWWFYDPQWGNIGDTRPVCVFLAEIIFNTNLWHSGYEFPRRHTERATNLCSPFPNDVPLIRVSASCDQMTIRFRAASERNTKWFQLGIIIIQEITPQWTRLGELKIVNREIWAIDVRVQNHSLKNYVAGRWHDDILQPKCHPLSRNLVLIRSYLNCCHSNCSSTSSATTNDAIGWWSLIMTMRACVMDWMGTHRTNFMWSPSRALNN